MSDLTDYAEVKLLEHVLARTAYTKPTNVYVSLFTTATSDAGGGNEVSGGSYARQSFSVNAVTSGAGTTKPSADVVFPVASASWGTITHVAIFDAASGGNMLMHKQLVASKTIANGDQLMIAQNDLTFTMA